jgi:SLOG cluster2
VSSSSKHRSRQLFDTVIGFSIAYQQDNLLERGFGMEHLREMLLRLARMMLRQGASLAYGGHWKEESEDNFTYNLLRLINAEQEDNISGGPDTSLNIGRLYSHSSWPYYLKITPSIEAQWINCCRIVRISQEDAGFEGDEIVPDAEAYRTSYRALFNAAVTLSAMRRLMMQPRTVPVPELDYKENIPPVVARVILGGKTSGFSGFMPGIFEEALVTLEVRKPLYLLGGFGGAAETLAQALLAKPDTPRPPEFTVAWHEENTPGYAQLLESAADFRLPVGFLPPEAAFEALWQKIVEARKNLSDILQTGLNDDKTRELLVTCEMNTAIQLVREGLTEKKKLTVLPA